MPASRLPVQLGSKLTSRISARAIRALLDGQAATAQGGGEASRAAPAGVAQGTPFVSTADRDAAAVSAASAAAATPTGSPQAAAGPLSTLPVSVAAGRSVAPNPPTQSRSGSAGLVANQQPAVAVAREEGRQTVLPQEPLSAPNLQRPLDLRVTQTPADVDSTAGAPAVAPTMEVRVDQTGRRRSDVISLNGATASAKTPVRMIDLSAAQPRTERARVERSKAVTR